MPFIKRRKAANNYGSNVAQRGRTRLQTGTRLYSSAVAPLPSKDKQLADYLRVISDPFTANPAPMPYLPSMAGIQVTKQTARFQVTVDPTGGSIGFVQLRPSFGNDLPCAQFTDASGVSVILPFDANPGQPVDYANWQGCPFTNSEFFVPRDSGAYSTTLPIVRGRCVAMAARIYNTTPASARGGAVYVVNGGAEAITGLGLSTIELLRSRGGVRDGDADGGYSEVAWAPAHGDLHWSNSNLPPSWQDFKVDTYVTNEIGPGPAPTNAVPLVLNPQPSPAQAFGPISTSSVAGRFGFLIEAPGTTSATAQTYICEVVGVFEYSGWASTSMAITHQPPLHHSDVPNALRVVQHVHSQANTARIHTPLLKSSIGRAFSSAVGWVGRQFKRVGHWGVSTATQAAKNAWGAIENVAPTIAKDAIIAALG